ncbi:T-cell immunoglobulin and mucin domain-containing protein 4 [Hoplias malabaricus]|uniref:T-cell immunoglobulin and mucin domain-containing protein 4 n=1 Tax=Hoplias malabaricus TaxID=27720 RepID=UPI003462ABC1
MENRSRCCFQHLSCLKRLLPQKMLTSVIITTLSFFIATYEASVLTVVGLLGATVTLPCKYDVKTHGTSNICWGRGQSWFSCEYTLIATDGLSVKFTQSQRYRLPSMLHKGDVALTIKRVQKEDSGFYTCRIEVPGLFNDLSSTVFLIVTNGLVPVSVTTHTPFSEEKQVETEDTTVENPRADSVSQLVNPEDTLETFILTTLRVGAIIFIPGLVIAVIWKLQRSRDQTHSSREERAPSQLQDSRSPPYIPAHTPQQEDI